MRMSNKNGRYFPSAFKILTCKFARQPAKRGQVLFQFLHGVVIDLMPLEKCVHLQGRAETEKLPHLFHGEIACPVGFSGEILKKDAGRVSVRRNDLAEQFIWNVNNNAHNQTSCEAFSNQARGALQSWP